MPSVPGFLTAVSFYFDVGAPSLVPEYLGTILTGFSEIEPLELG
jgi:hypothetical protein